MIETMATMWRNRHRFVVFCEDTLVHSCGVKVCGGSVERKEMHFVKEIRG